MNLLPQEIIRRKRDGEVLSDAELESIVQGITDGTVAEGQIAAFAMAVFFQGLNIAERVALTRAMTHSGTVLDWSVAGLHGPVVDKHSTGGVGDKVSLVLAPLLAACGAYVPMISGRGLGHTGGTLDKFDSIPGYNTMPDIDLFRRVVKQVGCAVIGQTATLAPADKRFYAIRDVTATVESIGLITASILSKKLASGLQGLVMDVKTGSGAFVTNIDVARELAASIVNVANRTGLPTSALISDMNQVLGDTAGNALEVLEAVYYLTGARRNHRLHELVSALAAEMLMLGGLVDDTETARNRLDDALSSGRAVEVFAAMVNQLGGPTDFVERAEHYLPQAPYVTELVAGDDGFVVEMDVRAMGIVVVELGGGRRKAEDVIDHAVGLSDVCRLGTQVEIGQPLLRVHARNERDAEIAVATLRRSITVEPAAQPQPQTPIVYEKVVC